MDLKSRSCICRRAHFHALYLCHEGHYSYSRWHKDLRGIWIYGSRDDELIAVALDDYKLCAHQSQKHGAIINELKDIPFCVALHGFVKNRGLNKHNPSSEQKVRLHFLPFSIRACAHLLYSIRKIAYLYKNVSPTPSNAVCVLRCRRNVCS